MTIKLRVVVDDISDWHGVDDTILREDMYQATYDNYGVDCGWYGDDNGFVTYLIKDFDWEMPVLRISSHNIQDARWSIQACKEYLTILLKDTEE